MSAKRPKESCTKSSNESLYLIFCLSDILTAPLGMESGAIKHSQLSVRMPSDASAPAMQGRLFMTDSAFYSPYFYTPYAYNLEIYLREIHMVSGLVLQGSGFGDQMANNLEVDVGLGPLPSDWVSVEDPSGTALVNIPFTLEHSDSKVHGPNMEPTWGRQDPGGPHGGHIDLVMWVIF